MLKEKFDDFETQRQSDEYVSIYDIDHQEDDFDDWLKSIGVTPEEFEADMKALEEMEAEELQADLEAQDRWYHETFEDVIWSDFLEQMTYAND